MSSSEHLKFQDVLKFDILFPCELEWNHGLAGQEDILCCNKKRTFHPLFPALHNLPYAGVQQCRSCCVSLLCYKSLSGLQAGVSGVGQGQEGQCCPGSVHSHWSLWGFCSQLAGTAELSQHLSLLLWAGGGFPLPSLCCAEAKFVF